ncbi:hypothetical protein [Xanthomonas fragariae]|uniref:hypothetical protein n=1 Tax=Xanthomonas fragariae TaxID=48664 RepID=UPI0022AB0A57|nr:hypothetical protein [Xanthomonas fragariae]WAT15990.1 hypothetical protein OZ429_06630 [Xanthomonas fragariae]
MDDFKLSINFKNRRSISSGVSSGYSARVCGLNVSVALIVAGSFGGEVGVPEGVCAQAVVAKPRTKGMRQIKPVTMCLTFSPQ